jgi:acyl carrier protein
MANPHVTSARVEDEVRKALGKALRKDPAGLPLDASIVRDLGGSSLDFLDITFRLEQAFGIRLAHTVILDHVEETFGEGTAVTPGGELTPAAVALLRLRLGDHAGLAEGMFADEIPAMLTGAHLARKVEDVLAELPAACTHCRATAWKSEDGAKVVCGSCGKPAAYPDGDALTKRWLAEVQREKGLFAAV